MPTLTQRIASLLASARLPEGNTETTPGEAERASAARAALIAASRPTRVSSPRVTLPRVRAG